MLDGVTIDRIRPLFRENAWAEIQRIVEPGSDPESRYLCAWALLGRGKEDQGVALLKELFAKHSDGQLVSVDGVQWNTWALRQKFGAAKVLAWGLLPELVKRGWAALADYNFDFYGDPHPFAKDWMSPELRGYFTRVPARHRHPVPWQLGGAMGALPDAALPRLRGWAIERASTLGTLTHAEKQVLEKLKAADYDALADLRAVELRPREREQAKPMDVFRAVLTDAPPDVLMLMLGLAVATVCEPAEAQKVSADVDAYLQVEDLRGRLPKESAKLGKNIKRVLFRATPMRVVETAVAALHQKGRFGTLARRAGPTGAALVWFEGEKDEALATVPDAHFKDAVAVLQAYEG